jgi:hypothetical protein
VLERAQGKQEAGRPHYPTTAQNIRRSDGAETKNARHLYMKTIFEPFIYKKRSFCQDRLGTNIGKTKNAGGFSSAAAFSRSTII